MMEVLSTIANDPGLWPGTLVMVLMFVMPFGVGAWCVVANRRVAASLFGWTAFICWPPLAGGVLVALAFGVVK